MNKKLSFCSLALVAVAALQAAAPYPGYTLVPVKGAVHLYDMNKKNVHTWDAKGLKIETTPYLLEDGSVLIPVSNPNTPFPGGGGHPNGRFLRIGWDNKVIWDYAFFGQNFTPGYDIQPMPNGNVLVLVSYENPELPGRIYELQPEGANNAKVVWECDVTAKLPGVSGYMNSISYNPGTDQIAISIQEPGRTVAVIDHKTGSIVSTFNQGFKSRIHACCWILDTYIGSKSKIPDMAKGLNLGNIMVVSNGNRECVELNPKTSAKVKGFQYGFNEHQGGVQRLPNGNTLVVKGYSPDVDELDENGKSVWSLKASAMTMRAWRYGLDYPGVSKLKKALEEGLENPEESNCTEYCQE